MKTSEQINELAEALSQAQAEMEVPKKDKKAQYGAYASLGSILTVIKGPLKNHGLSITQQISGEGGNTILFTTLMHKSGQFISSNITVVPLKHPNPLQGLGGALTYLKRYSIAAMLCIDSDEDNDGNEGTQTKNSTTQTNGNGNQAVTQQKKEDQRISEEEYKGMMQVISSYPLLVTELKAICSTQDLRHIPKERLKACSAYAKKYIENIDKQEVSDDTV